jgi:hypothetical protein
MPQLSSADLERFAKEAVTYEVTTMVVEAGHPTLHGSDPILRIALLEAVLVHVRLLDDFHGQSGANYPNDITADDYLPTWSPKRTLSQPARQAINAQLAHVSIHRITGYTWPVETLVADTCRTFVSFVDQLQASDPARAVWFAAAYQVAKQQVGKHAAMLATPGMSVPMSTTSPSSATTVTLAQSSTQKSGRVVQAAPRGPVRHHSGRQAPGGHPPQSR